MDVHLLPAFKDNYIYLVHDPLKHINIVVDPGDSDVVKMFLSDRQWDLHAILITHHHWDHIDGVEELQNSFKCQVIGSVYDQSRLPPLTQRVQGGDCLEIGSASIQVLFVPGHTTGHIAYYFSDQQWLFVGDTLFSMGCGRIFEGTPEMLFNSLQQLLLLPDSGKVFCTHEYTLTNAKFALQFEPNNPDLLLRIKQAEALRANHQPTLPTTIMQEKATNPFLRLKSPAIRQSLNMATATDLEVFTRLRELRNQF
ncbi:MAG: hydroxyacylglutathione hydrolase [Pseudobdellovibrionaceae bacterium]|nr:hydroxyacylglutathione hydrolase [Bdellovibrionales bacterium]USN48552.1 MAG: hydroxyacylglutathione hydrolase [Pseudobdellovibrionaceae bacterium]